MSPGDDSALVEIPAVAADDRGVWFATEAGQVGRITDGRVSLTTLTDVNPPRIAIWRQMVTMYGAPRRGCTGSTFRQETLSEPLSSPGD